MAKRRLPVTALVGGSLLLASCASNPFQQFYTGHTSASPELAGRIVAHGGTVQLFRGGSPEEDMLAMFENGYVLLGYSSFNGPSASQAQVLGQATAIGAAVAVLYSKYSNTISGTVPLVLPAQPTTAVSNVQGSVIGPGGYATYTGTGTTTLYGGTTTYNIPYNVDRFDQFATFWAKGRPPVLGVFARDLSPAERAELERNGGVTVMAVMRDSPAFNANLLRGDIILALNGVQVEGQQQFFGLLEPLAGTDVSLEIHRAGERRIIHLRLASPQ